MLSGGETLPWIREEKNKHTNTCTDNGGRYEGEERFAFFIARAHFVKSIMHFVCSVCMRSNILNNSNTLLKIKKNKIFLQKQLISISFQFYVCLKGQTIANF